jgi:rod shape-determining protein MreC
MINVPRSAPVAVGDSIVTSQYSYLFPQGIMVGTVAAILEDKTSNFFTLKVKPATNFYNVEYVTVVENVMKEEQKKLEEATRKNQ